MASCQELADDRWARFAPSAKARPDAGVRTPQQGAARRAGLRYWPVISGASGDRSARETDQGVRRSAPAPVGALLPLAGERKQTRGTRPRQSCRRSVG